MEPRARRSTAKSTFVVGNPGSTQRLFTSAQLAFQRELALPITLATYSELRGRLIAAMRIEPEKAREGPETLGGLENSLKVYIGRVKALDDPAFTGKLAAAEAAAQGRRAPAMPPSANPWADIADGDARLPRLLSSPTASRSPAGRPVRLCDDAGPRRRRARQAQRRAASRLFGFGASAGREADCSTNSRSIRGSTSCTMEWSLSASRANILAPTIPRPSCCSARNRPKGWPRRLVAGTKLADPAVRKALWEGGKAAIDASNDPMIVYARSIDANDRALQKRYDAAGRRPADRGPGQARRCPLRRLWRRPSIPTRPSRCASATARSPAGMERGKPVPTADHARRHLRPRDRRLAVRPAAGIHGQPVEDRRQDDLSTSSPPTTSSAAIRARR